MVKTNTFLDSLFTEDTPRFSPNGNWGAYYSTESGRPEVYVQSWRSSSKKIPISNGGGFYPIWSADGIEVFYRKGNSVFSVEIGALGAGIKTSSSMVLFKGNYLTAFDVGSDGEKFLMVKNSQGTLPTKLHLVLSWTEELKAAFDSDK